MTDHDDALARLVRRAVRPVGAERPRRDLWIDVRARLDRPGRRTPWIDWAIAAVTAASVAALPEVLPTLLYLL